MCGGKALWKRVAAFGLTLSFGIFSSGGSAGVFQKQNSNQTAALQPQFNQPKVLFEPKEFNKDSNPKPLCKRYADDELLKLRFRHEIMTLVLERNTSLTSKKRKIYLKKIAEIEKRIKNISSKITPKKKNTLPNESKPVHNLLFVPNCEEY